MNVTKTTATATVVPTAKAPSANGVAPTKLDRALSSLGRSDSFIGQAKRAVGAGATAGWKTGLTIGLVAGFCKEGIPGALLVGLGGALLGGLTGAGVGVVAGPSAKALSRTHRQSVGATIGAVVLGAGSLLAFRNGSAVVPGLIVGAFAGSAAAKR
jgi:hypothetical protein